jgi:glycosyltransferase involved in cell wall biosynthesis
MRILFASWDGLHRLGNGAAAAMRALLTLMHARGHGARFVCGPLHDLPADLALSRHFAEISVRVTGREEQRAGTFLDVRDGDLEGRVWDLPSRSTHPTESEGRPFLVAVAAAIAEHAPDVVLTHTPGWIGRELVRIAQDEGLPIVARITTLRYTDEALLRNADALLVPSKFAADHYRSRFGVEARAIPSPVRVQLAASGPRDALVYVTPNAGKGLVWAAAIFDELARRRRRLPIVVAQGRGSIADLRRALETDVPFEALERPSTSEILSRAKVLLCPYVLEAGSRLVQEGAFAGVPAIGSDRGALPEMIGAGGVVLPLAHWYPEGDRRPSDAEVRPWVDAVERIFDEPAFAAQLSAAARAGAERFDPARLATAYESALSSLVERP